jgi:hypothetical protein
MNLFNIARFHPARSAWCTELGRTEKMIVKAYVFAITSAAYILVMDKRCGASRKPRMGLPRACREHALPPAK